MRPPVRSTLAALALLTSALWLVTGCKQQDTSAQAAAPTADHMLAAGTRIDVTLGTTLSSETAQVGDAWNGTVSRGVSTAAGAGIPAGSRVVGEVAGVTAARRGSRAMLRLDLTRIELDGREQAVAASAPAVIAGSTRKRNVGAIAGGVLAGALIGKVVGDGRNAAAGGLVGGAAATGVVASSKGFQVVLANGQPMHFTVSQAVAMR